MLRQLSEDRQAFLPREQLTPTSCIERGPSEGFGWEQSFFGISLKASGLVLLFLPSVQCSLHNAEPRFKKKQKTEATVSQRGFI